MSRFIPKILFALALFMVGIPPSFAYGLSHPKNLGSILSQIDEHIKVHVKSKQVAGCAVAVVYQNKIVFLNAYGVKSLGKPDRINVDTVFQLGSVSKPIAATLVSVLENKGFLRLEDPIQHYLPNFSLNTKQSSHKLQVKHVLSHSTGVPRTDFNHLIESHQPYNTILRALQRTPVRTPIGKRYDYHNAMFGLISDITRSATRSSFKDALSVNLLKPLQMTNTTATLSGLLTNPNRAFPHVRNGKAKLTPCDTYSRGYYNVAPAGGINSSIRDMAIFLNAQMGGYPTVLNKRTLSRTQTAQISTPCTLSAYNGPAHLIKNARYGLGWRIVDFSHHKLLFHGGWVKGFTNFIAFMPDQKIGIVVLQNGETRFSSKTAIKFFELYLGITPTRKHCASANVIPARKTCKKTIKIINRSQRPRSIR